MVLLVLRLQYIQSFLLLVVVNPHTTAATTRFTTKMMMMNDDSNSNNNNNKNNNNKTFLQIEPPKNNEDWTQIANLVVETFEEPYILDAHNNNNVLEKLYWKFIEKGLTEMFTYRQYVRTARRMSGKKYSVIVARRTNSISGNKEVVGMMELGMTLLLLPDDAVSDARPVPVSVTPTPTPTPLPVPMMGVLCVRHDYRRDGIASELIAKCEDIVFRVWKEKHVYVQVEPSNVAALALFENSNGFCRTSSHQMINATVARRRKYEKRQHLVLKKGNPSLVTNYDD